MKLTKEQLEQLAAVDIRTLDADSLPDVGGYTFDRSLPQEERLQRFLEQCGGSPYCFNVGGVGVKLEFEEGGSSLQDQLAAYLIRQKSGL